MSSSSVFDLSEAVYKSWNKQRRLCYLILGLIVVVVLIAHFVVWTVHYGTYVSTPCYRNATGGPHLVYDEPLTSGSYAHIILCLWAVVIGIFDTLEYIQITWGYVGRKYTKDRYSMEKLSLEVLPKCSFLKCCYCNSRTYGIGKDSHIICNGAQR